jgi:hypothetical protein
VALTTISTRISTRQGGQPSRRPELPEMFD